MRLLLSILCLVFYVSLATGQTKNFLDIPYLETTAKVDTLITPDRIYLNITIQEKDSRGKKSIEEQENKMAQGLKAIGINLEKQLVIKDLSSNFKKYFLRQKEVLKSKQYALLVYDGETAGKALMALEELGIANTYLEKTEYAEIEALELELKSMAVQKAKRKAEALTRPLGQKIGAAIHILDTSIPYYPRYDHARMEMDYSIAKAAMTPEPLAIDFEKIRVETTVNIKFKILE
ncbi:MAG: SIMPL domain-containing protein [Bacteroidota bacterium]